MRPRVLIGALFGFAAACTTPIDIAVHGPPLGAAASGSELKDCTVAFAAISDARLDPTTIGSVEGRLVRGPSDGVSWLREALSPLRDYGATLSFEPETVDRGRLTASAKLVAVSVSSAYLTTMGSVILVVHYARNGQILKQASYRGSDSRVNWIDAGENVQNVIEGAFAQILTEMVQDLEPLCRSMR